MSSNADAVTQPVLPSASETPQKLLVSEETVSESLIRSAVAPINGTTKEAPAQDAERVKKRQNALTRVVWTFIMIGGFIGNISELTTFPIDLTGCYM